jgi:hypothetical protein
MYCIIAKKRPGKHVGFVLATHGDPADASFFFDLSIIFITFAVEYSNRKQYEKDNIYSINSNTAHNVMRHFKK